MTGDTRTCLRFRIGSTGFAVPVEMVEEIAAVERICAVPLAPAAVRGLATWRGRVVTLLDLATLLGVTVPEDQPRTDRLALILMRPYEHLGLYLEGPVELSHETVARATIRADLSGKSTAGVPRDRDADSPVATVRLLSVTDLVAGCERAVHDQFRRRIDT